MKALTRTALLTVLFAWSRALAAGGTLQDGRYAGWIHLDATKERIALVADFFQESPEDFTQFPSRNAVFRLSLGGYHTHEYFTEVFKNILYDFDYGSLTLDEPKNDLLITAELSNGGVITGKVFIRSSAVWGTLYLKYETDEPEDEDEAQAAPNEGSPFVPLLEGQYEGTCGDEESAALQIQTVRGVKTRFGEKAKDTSAFGSLYGIVGRIAGASPGVCALNLPKGLWCNNFNYPTATYNPYLGKLVLQGSHAADSCEIHQGDAVCRFKIQTGIKNCRLKKAEAPKQAKAFFFNRTFHASPTSAQLEELPPPSPPKNEELKKSLEGVFSGYLHNESNDTYQMVQLNVVPYSYSNNPHNPNQMAFSSTASLHVGDPAKRYFVTQRYEPRSFYLRPGLTLSGPDTDSFIGIQEWKRGFLRGIWYSHAYGRVGTIELVKEGFLAPPAGMRLVGNFAAEYRGAPPLSSSTERWIQLVFPAQPNAVTGSTVIFSGSAQSSVGITPATNIESGAFDLYTGRFGWVYSHGDAETLTSAYLDDQGDLHLYWPPSPKVFGTFLSAFEFQLFPRLRP